MLTFKNLLLTKANWAFGMTFLKIAFASLLTSFTSLAPLALFAPLGLLASPALSSSPLHAGVSINQHTLSTPIYCDAVASNNNGQEKSITAVDKHRYKVVKLHPHRQQAFTQGLVYDKGILYESTGQYGQSRLEKIDLTSGEVLARHFLDKTIFAEGLTLFNKQLIQLSWKSGQVFRYGEKQLKPLAGAKIQGEGWGITHNGKNLITSDGSNQIHFRDPETLATVKTLAVRYGQRPLKSLNELEWINGCVLANVWQTPTIAVINPSTGYVTGTIDLAPLQQHAQRKQTQHQQGKIESDKPKVDVANGIAFIPQNGHLLVTGKYWPFVYELKIID